MVDIKVRIENLDRFLEAMKTSPRIMAKHLQRGIEMAGNQFLAGTKENIRTGRNMWKPPIDTGRMWNSLFLSVDTFKATITPQVNYAIYVHQGTIYMEARPFFEITESTEKANIEKIFVSELNQALNEIAP